VSPASSSFVSGDRTGMRRRRPTSQPRPNTIARRARPATGASVTSVVYGGSGRSAPVGNTPASRPTPTRSPANTHSRSRVRSARNAGASGSARRRQRTRRSTTPRANGTTQRTSVKRMAHPLAARSLKKMLSGVRNGPPTLASSEPTSASVARPSWPRRRTESGASGSPAGTAGSPFSDVVSAIAATPCSRNGPCSPAANGMPRSTS